MTPEAVFFEGSCDSVSLTLSDGTYEILYNHAPVALALSTGFIRLKCDGTEVDFWNCEGICTVKDNKVEIFVDICSASEKVLSLSEMRSISEAQNKKRAVMEHHRLKIAIARAITSAKKKTSDNI